MLQTLQPWIAIAVRKVAALKKLEQSVPCLLSNLSLQDCEKTIWAARKRYARIFAFGLKTISMAFLRLYSKYL
jgi:hypothetical protein